MDLKGRNFLKLLDYTPEEMTYLLDLAAVMSILMGGISITACSIPFSKR